MKTTLICLLFACSVALIQPAFAQETETTPEKGSRAEKRKAQWSFEADPELPNVLILGDSISIGYTLIVREQLKGKANVYRPLAKDEKRPQNCGGTIKGLGGIDRWLTMADKWDVIHFNWGLHDLKHVLPKSGGNSNSYDDPRQSEPEAYQANLETIVEKLKATGAKLIFATTTPYPEGCEPARLAADADRYNEIATKIMKANDIPINDLNALVKDDLGRLQLKVNVHFNKAGNKVLSEQVASVIESALEDDSAEAEKAPDKQTEKEPADTHEDHDDAEAEAKDLSQLQ